MNDINPRLHVDDKSELTVGCQRKLKPTFRQGLLTYVLSRNFQVVTLAIILSVNKMFSVHITKNIRITQKSVEYAPTQCRFVRHMQSFVKKKLQYRYQ